MIRFHGSKRQSEIVLAPTHSSASRLYGNGVNFTEERIDKGEIVKLHLKCACCITVQILVAHLGSLLRKNVGKHGDNALSAKRHYGNYLVIVTGIDVDIVAAKVRDLCDLGNISACFLNCNDVRMLCKNCTGCRSKVTACSARYVIKDAGLCARVCNDLKDLIRPCCVALL